MWPQFCDHYHQEDTVNVDQTHDCISGEIAGVQNTMFTLIFPCLEEDNFWHSKNVGAVAAEDALSKSETSGPM